MYVFIFSFISWCWFCSLFCYQKNLQDQKKNRTHNKATSKNLHHEFTWFSNVSTSIESATHHHIDHEITSSIQATASFDLSWCLSNKTSLNHLVFFLLMNSLNFLQLLYFVSQPTKNNMIKHIYTLGASPRNKGYALVPKPIQL